jgi:uncharacterized protein YxjI
VKVQELLDDLRGRDPEMEIVVQLYGNEFEDGDMLDIDDDMGTTVMYGKVCIPALTNEPGE